MIDHPVEDGQGTPLLTVLGQLRACQAAWWPRGGLGPRPGPHCPAGTTHWMNTSQELPGSGGNFFSAQSVVVVCWHRAEHDPGLPHNLSGTLLQLSESRLCFADLAQLVLFYSLTETC
ncbi:unnamed protein product [Gadus morhua 'NCC']